MATQRREKGEGTIYTDSKGYFRAAIYVNGERKSVSDKTRSGILKKLADLKVAKATGKITTKDPTVETLLREWIQGIKRDKEPRTFEYYEGICRLHLLPHIGKLKISQLDVKTVENLLADKLASGLSVRRVAMIRATLRAALHQAERWDYCHRNVAALSKPPTGDNATSRVHMPTHEDYSVKNAIAYLNAATNYRSKQTKDPSVGNMVCVMLGTAFRFGECAGLVWEALETNEVGQYAAIRIYQQVQRNYVYGGKSEVITKSLKTKASVATVSIPDFVRDALISQAEWRDKNEFPKTGFVFITRNGNPFMHRNVTREFKRMQETNGLVQMRIHDMRHMCAALLIEQGRSLSVVKDALRHTNIKTTGDVYAHVTGRARTEAMRGLDDILRPTKSEGERTQ